MRKLFNAARTFGVDVNRFAASIRGIPQFVQDLRQYQSSCDTSDVKPILSQLKPILADRYASSGSMGSYFFQDLWAARKIHKARPHSHVDIGSRIDGFVGSLLTFMDVEVIDVRQLESPVGGLRFTQGDGTNLYGIASNSRESVSSLHAVEHFGLGRYGDSIDPKGSLKAMAELQRILAPGGSLYFSVPMGTDRVEFNAHRVFSPQTILQQFANLEVVEFALLDKHGRLRDGASEQAGRWRCGVGLFHFKKPDIGA